MIASISKSQQSIFKFTKNQLSSASLQSSIQETEDGFFNLYKTFQTLFLLIRKKKNNLQQVINKVGLYKKEVSAKTIKKTNKTKYSTERIYVENIKLSNT